MHLALLALPMVLTSPFAKSMDTAIDGRSIEAYHESRFDSKRGLYLFSSGECDGAHRRLTLSTDFKAIMKNEGYHSMDYSPAEMEQIIKERKQELRPDTIKGQTNLGIKLGMSPTEVKRILGAPDVTMNSKKFNAFELIYNRKGPKDKEGLYREYKNYYLFRGDKLFYIELKNDLIGGGC